jgi:hypothetical protein
MTQTSVRQLAVLLLAALALPMVSQAEILDRIAATVEGKIITLSDLRQEREIRRALGEKPINDDGALVKQLIDTYLIERQIGQYPNIDATDDEIAADLQKVKAESSVPAARLRAAISGRIRMQKFFDIRFRQLIRPNDDEIRRYYNQVFAPEAKARGLETIPALSDPEMANAIRENVIQETLDHEVDMWLEAIRRRSNIEVFQ